MELRGIGNASLARPLGPSRLWIAGAVGALVALTALRLWVASAAPLSPDEAYYWVWSRALAPGYLDHPPMVAMWIRAGTLLAGPSALGVRLAAPIAAALASLLLAKAAQDLLPRRTDQFEAALVGAALANATLLFGVGAVMMTPDTPLLFFWTAALWALGRVHRSGNGAWWLAVGAAVGLALDSKYAAALLPLAVALWALLAPGARRWVVRPEPWAGLLVAIALFLPTLVWNGRHGWASFLRQGGRVWDWDTTGAARHVAELIAGQIGLATPLVFLFCIAGIGLALGRIRDHDPCWALLALTATVPAAVLFEHAIGDRVQANWPSVIYPSAIIAAAALDGRAWKRLRAPAIGLGCTLSLAVYVHAVAAPLPLPRRYDPMLTRLGGWTDFAAGVETARRRSKARYVAVEAYGEASQLARLLPPGVPVIGIDPRWGLFALSSGRAQAEASDGLLIETARHGPPTAGAWQSAVEIGSLVRSRNGIAAESYRLYRVSGLRSSTPTALLPRP